MPRTTSSFVAISLVPDYGTWVPGVAGKAHHRRYGALVAGVNHALFAGAQIEAGDRVLDVGCGAGATTRIAARLAAHGHAVGVDIPAPLLERARDAVDTVDFLLSRRPGRILSAADRAALEDAVRPYETDRGVRLRGGVWLVTATRNTARRW